VSGSADANRCDIARGRGAADRARWKHDLRLTDMAKPLVVLAADIRGAHAGAQASALAHATRALDAGRALIEAKALLKHGRWLPCPEDSNPLLYFP